MPRLDQLLSDASGQIGRAKRRRKAQQLQGMRDGRPGAGMPYKGSAPPVTKTAAGPKGIVSSKGVAPSFGAGPGRMSELAPRGPQEGRAFNRTQNARAGMEFERVPVKGGEWHMYAKTGDLVFVPQRTGQANKAQPPQRKRRRRSMTGASFDTSVGLP